jgi:hypothetical protein
VNGDPEFEARAHRMAMAIVISAALWVLVLFVMGSVFL